MPHPCAVCGRSRLNPNNREEEYMFFGFPVNDEERCKKWLEFCCREDLYKLTKKQLLQRMVCSKHFEQKDFLNEYFDRLNCTAVPSIYDPKQSLYNITCVLCGRSRKDPPDPGYDGTTFHHFPGEEFRCLDWLDFVGVDSYYRLTRKEILFCYICSKHFDRSQFMSEYENRLVDNAVPNIRHPEDGDVTELYTIVELSTEKKAFDLEEKPQLLEPMSAAVLESKACAACGRSRNDPKNKIERYKFHPFPAYEIGRCLRWCQFLGREDLLKMSPNQIRKLVLCSKHFQTGLSFHKVGPCDAVPTIKDISDESLMHMSDNLDDDPEGLDDTGLTKANKRLLSRPLVSSKKPKIDNKPMPLAKKRGKSRRPTSINIPKPIQNFDHQLIRKLPLPSTSNWKIQYLDQFQPITIANNISNFTSTDPNLKKILVPFPGNLSNLGTPIPVHSLASMPPGLLIKINLPEQEQDESKSRKKRGRGRKKSQNTSESMKARNEKHVQLNNGQMHDTEIEIRDMEQTSDNSLSELLTFSPEGVPLDEEEEEENPEETILPDSLGEFDNEEDEDMHIKQEVYSEYTEEEQEMIEENKIPPQRMTVRTRRTILPIKSEVKYFLHKIAPYMHRLPRKARAQVKLAIVNMVIDCL